MSLYTSIENLINKFSEMSSDSGDLSADIAWEDTARDVSNEISEILENGDFDNILSDLEELKDKILGRECNTGDDHADISTERAWQFLAEEIEYFIESL